MIENVAKLLKGSSAICLNLRSVISSKLETYDYSEEKIKYCRKI